MKDVPGLKQSAAWAPAFFFLNFPDTTSPVVPGWGYELASPGGAGAGLWTGKPRGAGAQPWPAPAQIKHCQSLGHQELSSSSGQKNSTEKFPDGNDSLIDI